VQIINSVNSKTLNVNKVREYFKETYNELVNKVSWPTWSELQGSAILVMVASLIVAILIYSMDTIFSTLMENIIYKL